jgi:hypothetical protein
MTMPQDSPQLPPVLTEQQRPGRPIPDMTANVNALVDQVRAIIDAYQAAGEVLLVIDLLTWKGVLTLHIPLPKG